MVASGVPCPRPDHAVALVNLALDMQAVIAERRFGGRQLAFRIGINSGPVVAGVIGRKKFIYDLWGETVNLASRMESYGRSRCVQITRGTHDLIKDRLTARRWDCWTSRQRAPRRCGTLPAEGLRLPTRRSNGRLLRSRSDAVGPSRRLVRCKDMPEV